ncbi:hypothetical protein [Pontibacter fetidus]|uniref:Uncharacterized protein n=1 Tax=Pontibacter fetidus TaxID=2700082 RepID=A0A6B2GYR0_9BACT|nr:hypothetical protein [Pontibacter fetidus]NDK55141.1 hypothetical protein [Pontibacter fetidus]
MKRNLWKIGVFCMTLLTFTACDQDEALQDVNPSNTNNLLAEDGCDVINFENVSEDGYVAQVNSMHGWGPVMVENTARNSNGEMEGGNRAMLFNTEAPTGDDDDLYTTDWGKALIIQELGIENEPNDNRWGGEMLLTFPEAVTLESMKVLDIDEYEDNSWVYLYDGAGNELYKVMLQPLGNNSKQTVDLGNTEGVMMLKVVLAGNDGYVGSGAIDDIMFCVSPVTPPTYEDKGCTRTQGYWKNHADPKKKQYDTTWDNYLNKTFYNSGMNYLAVLNTSPKGDAYIILAHQYIAAELNVASGASIPQDVLAAWNAATAYFKGETSPSRSELLAWAELLDDYNNGIVGPGHCD